MSYQTQWYLTEDEPFLSRCEACITAQSLTYRSAAQKDTAALARAILMGEEQKLATFQQVLAAEPDFAEMAEVEEGRIDSSLIPDADILTAVNRNWQIVASVYYKTDGNPLP